MKFIDTVPNVYDPVFPASSAALREGSIFLYFRSQISETVIEPKLKKSANYASRNDNYYRRTTHAN
jgi:hypothetical protein